MGTTEKYSTIWSVGSVLVPRDNSNSLLANKIKQEYYDRIGSLETLKNVAPPLNTGITNEQIKKIILPSVSGLKSKAYADALLQRSHNLLYNIWKGTVKRYQDLDDKYYNSDSYSRRVRRQTSQFAPSANDNIYPKPEQLDVETVRKTIENSYISSSRLLKIIQADIIIRSPIHSLKPELLEHIDSPFIVGGNILELLPIEIPDINPILPDATLPTHLPVDIRPLLLTLPSSTQLKREIATFHNSNNM